MADHSVEYLKARWNVHQCNARISLMIHLYGDELAERFGYDSDGMEAVAVYLCSRDSIPIEKSRLYSTDIMRLLLSKEMKAWHCPYTWEQIEALEASNSVSTKWRLLRTQAGLDYSTECFGDQLSRKENLGGLDGRDALQLYLINKHHWHPADVAALSLNAIRDVLGVEMQGWTMTTEQIAASKMAHECSNPTS